MCNLKRIHATVDSESIIRMWNLSMTYLSFARAVVVLAITAKLGPEMVLSPKEGN